MATVILRQSVLLHFTGVHPYSSNRVPRVGKVSGIEVSGRVSGMPEMPGTKPRFWAPETARNCPKLPETSRNYKS